MLIIVVLCLTFVMSCVICIGLWTFNNIDDVCVVDADLLD